MNLKVLGSGCANCRTLEARAIDALNTLGVDALVEKVTDYREIASYGVMSTPALAIDDQVVLAGRVPTVAELVDLIGGVTR
ncbi:MAG: thioredoxin family protein [Acidimicrobiia bacterium]